MHMFTQFAFFEDEAAFGATRGCAPSKRLRYAWPLGLDLIVDAFRAAASGRILALFDRLVSRTGTTFEQRLLGISGIDTIDPENIEAVLSSQFKEFGFGVRRPTFFPLLGDGIFTQDGSAWRHSRELLRPQFAKNRAQNFEQIQAAVQKLADQIPDGQPVDLQPLFFRFTLDTTTFLLFGESIGSLDATGSGHDSASEEADFAEAFTVAQDFLAQRGRLGDLYWLIGGPKFWRACKTVHRFVDSMVRERLRDSSNNRQSGAPSEAESKHVFLDSLLLNRQDVFTIRSQLLNVLLAGRDTTACCLSWTFRLLTQHPRVLAKLRAEIQSKVGTAPPSHQDLKKMTYLSWVLKEVLRLYPSVPINSRTALRTTTLPMGGGPDGRSPILIRKGMAIGYCTYLMHRRRDLYGADACEFRPERWDGDLERKVGWGYLPFNGGPRVCLGQDFALLEASLAIVRILQTFPDISPYRPGDKNVSSSASAKRIEPESSEVGEDQIGSERQMITLVISSADGCWVKASSNGVA
ncbi:cytochrome P450 [Neofusicoccum parvum]|uniref:Cytochrome P450 n=1 Tax=Neofusicoccum parvum TaxID=310453 RepID=A0ACB5SMR4_9PEZI|nr:cytochrome P450 [Neofusicoccum parvum]